MSNFKIPGFVYSLALAILAWGMEYLTQNGGGIPWAPLAIAIIPMAIKAIEVQTKSGVPYAAVARGMGEPSAPSKLNRFLLG